jgi:hypothetical protein
MTALFLKLLVGLATSLFSFSKMPSLKPKNLSGFGFLVGGSLF